MATVYYTGGAAPIADVWTLTIPAGAINAAETLTVTYTGLGNAMVLTVTTGMTKQQLSDLVASTWNAFTAANGNGDRAEYTAVSATVAADVATITFTQEDDFKGQLGGTFSVSDTIASGNASFAHTATSTGPYHFDNALNWSSGTVPVATDVLIFEGENKHVRYGLVNSADFTTVYIMASFGHVGLPDYNATGSYPEWRPRSLNLGSSTGLTYIIGMGVGDGSGLYRIDYGSNTGAFLIYKTGGSDLDDQAACIIRGGNSGSLSILGGDVSVGRTIAELSTWNDIYVSRGSDDDSPETEVTLGSGFSLIGTARFTGGATVDWDSGITATGATTMTIGEGSDVSLRGPIAVTTLNNFGALLSENYGTITTLRTFGPSGSLDLGGYLLARTITTLEHYPGTSLNVPYGHTLTLTNNVKLKGGAKPGTTFTYTGPPDVTLDQDYP